MFYKLACLGKVILINGSLLFFRIWIRNCVRAHGVIQFSIRFFVVAFFLISFILFAFIPFDHFFFLFRMLFVSSFISEGGGDNFVSIVLFSISIYSPNFSRTNCCAVQIVCDLIVYFITEHSFMLMPFSYQSTQTRVRAHHLSMLFCFFTKHTHTHNTNSMFLILSVLNQSKWKRWRVLSTYSIYFSRIIDHSLVYIHRENNFLALTVAPFFCLNRLLLYIQYTNSTHAPNLLGLKKCFSFRAPFVAHICHILCYDRNVVISI